MKKKLFVILLCGVMALGLAGCSNPVSDSKKELEDAKNDLEETYKKYGWVEKETVNTILAKFNTEIMDGGLNTPASDDYMVVDNGKYWFALTDDVAFYLKPVESSGNKEKDILNMSAIYMDNDKYDEATAIKYAKLLITDYSSVCYNSFYQGGGVIFFQPDLVHYQAEAGELIPADDEYIGYRVFNLDELEKVIEKAITDGKIRLETVRNKEFEKRYLTINEYHDGKNIERIAIKLKELNII